MARYRIAQPVHIESLKRFILALAGWQSGKSEIGPPWLLDEMGPGDYLVASPTFPLMLKRICRSSCAFLIA